MINTISDIDSKFTPQSTTLSLDSLHSLFEKRKSEHRIILKKNAEIIKLNSDIIKQNVEIMRQNAILFEFIEKQLNAEIKLNK